MKPESYVLPTVIAIILVIAISIYYLNSKSDIELPPLHDVEKVAIVTYQADQGIMNDTIYTTANDDTIKSFIDKFHAYEHNTDAVKPMHHLPIVHCSILFYLKNNRNVEIAYNFPNGYQFVNNGDTVVHLFTKRLHEYLADRVSAYAEKKSRKKQ